MPRPDEAVVPAVRLCGAAPAGLTIEINAHGVRTRLGFADVGAETLECVVAILEAELGAGFFAELWEQGAVLDPARRTEDVAPARRARGCPARGWDALTKAELEVVALVAEGLSNAEIGRRLFIAPATAKSHLHHVFGKLGVANRTQLAAAAIERRPPKHAL